MIITNWSASNTYKKYLSKKITKPMDFNLDEWEITYNKKIQQWNSSDCGVFVCCCMEAMVKKKYENLKFTNNSDYQMGRMHLLSRFVMGPTIP